MSPLKFSGLLLCFALIAPAAGAQTLSFERDDAASTTGARGIATADFNRDGWIDIVTAHHDPDGITVHLNRGAARGYSSTFIDLPGGPFDVVTGDLNKDGIPDIAVANPDANVINVLFGRAGGGFSGPMNVGARFNPRSLAIADMDKDGNPDIIFTEYYNRGVAIYWGDGAQSFTHRQPGLLNAGDNPQGVAVADFNVDGWPDMVVASSGSVGLTILYHTPGVNTFSRQDLPVPPQQNVVTIGDFDKDGRPDIAAASTNTSDITVVLNRRAGFSTHVFPSGGGSPRGIVTADLNRDGSLDLITGNRSTSTIQLALGRGDGTFATPVGYAAGTGSRAVAAGDFNHDGRVDLASANEYAPSMTVLSHVTEFPRAGFAFSRTLIGPGTGGYSGSSSAAVADFDIDGKLDVVTNGGGLHVHLGSGRSVVLSNQGAEAVAAAGVNGDGYPDVLAIQTGSATTDRSRIETYIGDGAGTFPGRRSTQTSLHVVQFKVADLNGDGREDVMVLGRTEWSGANPHIQVLFGNGDGAFTLSSTIGLERTLTTLSLGDVDRDGDLDLVTFVNTRSPGTPTVDTRLNDGRGAFGAPRKAAVTAFDGIYNGTLGDVNHDGYLDFAAAGNPTVYSTRLRIAVLLGGPAGFGEPAYLATTDFVNGLYIADITLDGHADILSDYGVLFKGRGDGTFDEPELFDFYVPRGVIVDFNRDGLPDIVAPEAQATVQVLLNERRDTNGAPTVDLGPDFTIEYRYQFGDGELELWARGTDPDLHKRTFIWRLPDGTQVDTGTFPYLTPPHMEPGRHEFVVEASDGRGGVATDSMFITVLPEKEIYLHVGNTWFSQPKGSWAFVEDSTAASGSAVHDVNAGLPKVTTPSAQPSGYVEYGFVADTTQTYKLWVRLKADGNHWTNDSVWLQFTNAVDASGRTFAPGTSSGIEVVLEECSGCGLSGWGWRDEAWGQRDIVGTMTIRFTKGGWQTLRIQTREDGVSVDQVVLSAETYRTTRPGAVKNDTKILPPVFQW